MLTLNGRVNAPEVMIDRSSYRRPLSKTSARRAPANAELGHQNAAVRAPARRLAPVPHRAPPVTDRTARTLNRDKTGGGDSGATPPPRGEDDAAPLPGGCRLSPEHAGDARGRFQRSVPKSD